MAVVALSDDLDTPDQVVEADRTDRIRLSLDLTPEMKAVIDRLARKRGASRAEVLRRGIALLDVIQEAAEQGQSPALIDAQGNVKARLVGV